MDISMCGNSACPSSNECYRFRAKPSQHWQSYCGFAPEKDDTKCDHFIDIVETDELNDEIKTK